MDMSSILAKKWGILIKRESESFDFTGLEIPRDYFMKGRYNLMIYVGIDKATAPFFRAVLVHYKTKYNSSQSLYQCSSEDGLGGPCHPYRTFKSALFSYSYSKSS